MTEADIKNILERLTDLEKTVYETDEDEYDDDEDDEPCETCGR